MFFKILFKECPGLHTQFRERFPRLIPFFLGVRGEKRKGERKGEKEKKKKKKRKREEGKTYRITTTTVVNNKSPNSLII